MHRFSSILVCLDFSAKDERVLHYVSLLVDRLSVKRLVFFHAARNDESLEASRAKLEALTASAFGENETLQVLRVVEAGDPLDLAIALASKETIDLIVVGKSLRNRDHDVLPVKFARRSRCSALLVPEGSGGEWDRVLVATDGSSLSREAMETAALLCSRIEGGKLILLRANDMPHGEQIFSGVGGVTNLKDGLRDAVVHFGEQSDLKGIPFETAILVNQKPSEAILETAKKRDARLIVMGSKGKGAVAATLLGSTAENVAKATTVPLLIVKSQKR